jgi:hypothetical protein
MEDCFAYANGGCGLLKSGKCPGCKFYKTHQQLRLEKQKAYDRLMDLGRLDLIETYSVERE